MAQSLYIHETHKKGETVWKVSDDRVLTPESVIFITLEGNCRDWRKAHDRIRAAIGFQIIPSETDTCTSLKPG